MIRGRGSARVLQVELARLGEDGVLQIGFRLGGDRSADPLAGRIAHFLGHRHVQRVGAQPGVEDEDGRLEALVRGLRVGGRGLSR